MAQAARASSPSPPDIPILVKATFGIAVLVNLYAVLRVATRTDSGIADVSNGAFSPDAALLSPAEGAFGIWTVIYLGVFGHSIRVWLPDSAAHRIRHRVILPAVAAALLNLAWIMCAQRGYVVVSALIIVVLLVVVWLAAEAGRTVHAHDLSALLTINGTYALYLGWLLIATPANIAAAIAHMTGVATGPAAVGLSLALLVAAGLVTVVATRRFGRNPGIPIAFCWGLAWVARSRSQGDLLSPEIAWAATVAAAVVAAVYGMGLLSPRRPRRAEPDTVTSVTSLAAS